MRILKQGSAAQLAGLVVVAHGIVLYRLASRMAPVLLFGLILVVLVKHIGIVGSIYA